MLSCSYRYANEEEYDDLLLSLKIYLKTKLDAMVSYQMGIYPDLEEAEIEDISKSMLEAVDWESIVTEVPFTPIFTLLSFPDLRRRKDNRVRLILTSTN